MIVRILYICFISNLDEKSFCFWFLIYKFWRLDVELMFLWIFNLMWLGNFEGMICSIGVIVDFVNLGFCDMFLFVDSFLK